MKKLFVRMVTMVLAISMVLMLTPMAFATMDAVEVEKVTDCNTEEATQEAKKQSARASTLVAKAILPGEYEDFYFELNNYVGLYKKFVAVSRSECTQGVLFIQLYNPDGKQVSYDWILGYDEAYSWDLFLPKAGTWRCRVIASGTDAVVTVTLGWQQ